MAEIQCKIPFPDGAHRAVCLDFLSFAHGLGQKFEGSVVYILRDICRQLDETGHDIPALGKDIAIEIAQRRDGEAQGTQLNRIRVLRKLAEYMISSGFDAYIIPKNFTQPYSYDFKPYIFSRDQITNLLKAADKLAFNAQAPHAHIVIPAIMRVLFGCGLRSSEARLMKANQVDLDNGILTIEKAKRNISRYVPMSESLTLYLRKYADDMSFDMSTAIYFFPAPGGGPYHDASFRERYISIMSKAKIPASSNDRMPRIHDARHSFVVHSYKKLTSELGLELYTALPIIAAYVGHSNLKDTERYIHLPSFDYSSITAAGASIIDACVPEVIFSA